MIYSHIKLSCDYIVKMKKLNKLNDRLGEKVPKELNIPPLFSPNQVSFLTISEHQNGQRLDNFLFRYAKGVPKAHIYQIIRSGQVRVNKKRVDQCCRLAIGDQVRIPPLEIKEIASPTLIPLAQLPILFEDDYILVIDKPAGIAVHGGSGISYGVIEQLRATRKEAPYLELVHRLDRDTSGILLLAKKRSALVHLQDQLRHGLMDKRYWALVYGKWLNKRQHIKLLLDKRTLPSGEKHVFVANEGQLSHTIVNLVERYTDYTLLEAELKTGRTHQIRVHLAASGFPIIGDQKYGHFELNKMLSKSTPAMPAFKRMFLHAHAITFIHPHTEEKMRIDAPLPKACAVFLEQLS